MKNTCLYMTVKIIVSKYFTDVKIIQAHSSDSTQVSYSVRNLSWSSGSINIYVALIWAEHMLLKGSSNGAKVIVILFANQPNWSYNCGSCACFNVNQMCNHDHDYP
jgi:hypothetical protein